MSVALRCARCGVTIMEVDDSTAEGFASGSWFCGERACTDARRTGAAAAEGRVA